MLTSQNPNKGQVIAKEYFTVPTQSSKEIKLQNDKIYFVESGEFVAYSTTFASSQKQDIQQENQKNKNFLSETIKTHSSLSPGRKNHSYRNIIRNDKFKSLTRKPNLLR